MSKRTSKEEIDRFHDYGIYVPSRAIYIGSEIVDADDESGVDALLAERVIKNILVLETQSQDPILIVLNNPGGFQEHGMAIYDKIKACKCHVTIQVFGQASSMASIILQAADERVMSENSVQMIHYGWSSAEGHPKTVDKIVKQGNKTDDWMERMYFARIKEKNPKFKLSKLQKMLDHDTFLSAEESIELGLCDKVLK